MIRITQYVPFEAVPRVQVVNGNRLRASLGFNEEYTYVCLMDQPLSLEPDVWSVPLNGSLEIEAL